VPTPADKTRQLPWQLATPLRRRRSPSNPLPDTLTVTPTPLASRFVDNGETIGRTG
jgi:hypothetical protein